MDSGNSYSTRSSKKMTFFFAETAPQIFLTQSLISPIIMFVESG